MIGFLRKYKLALIAGAVIIAVLVAAFMSGGSLNKNEATPDSAANQAATQTSAAATAVQDKTEATNVSTAALTTTASKATASQTQPSTNIADTTQSVTEKPEETAQTATQAATKDKYNTDPIPSGKPQPVEPQEQTVADDKIYCTFSISCATILDNMDDLNPDLLDIIPEDGWILKPERVEVNDGESVFDVLIRVCKEHNIHTEYSWTPVYNSSYIEGIANIYEYDCGDQSGWIYKVNSWAPNYGCSRYVVSNNDVIEWKYTCDLGRDV